jgi:hypothetical protein
VALDANDGRDIALRFAFAEPDKAADIDAAIELGNRARLTLGHMPYAAYRFRSPGGLQLDAPA